MSAAATAVAPQLRPMADTDLDTVAALEERSYPFPWTRGIFADCLRVGYSCWVLEAAEGVIGYAILSVAAGEAHILNICVAPTLQRQGHGAVLLERLMNVARYHQAQRVFLEVRPSNHGAIAMYRRRGFEEVGRRPNYYPDFGGQREDAIVMARKLCLEKA